MQGRRCQRQNLLFYGRQAEQRLNTSAPRLGAHRRYLRQALCSATSSWALLNYKTRRLGKMPEDILYFYRQHMPQAEQRTIPIEETKLKLPASSEGVQCSMHTPSDVHTDMNDHVNNTAYLTWILDSIPDAVQETHMIAQYEVDYKAEARKGVHCSHCLAACAMCALLQQLHESLSAPRLLGPVWSKRTLVSYNLFACLLQLQYKRKSMFGNDITSDQCRRCASSGF